MPFTVAFWNLQRLTDGSSQHKQDLVIQFITGNTPDLFCCCEIGQGFFPTIAANGYEEVGCVHTLAESRRMGVESREAQLCLAAFKRTGAAGEVIGRVLRNLTPDGSQLRAKLKVNVRWAHQLYSIYVIHANASVEGGIAAISSGTLDATAGKKTVTLGDFNYDLHLDAHRQQVLTNAKLKVGRQIDPTGNVKKTHKRGGELDYALASQDTTIAPVVLQRYLTWKTIDHSPIMFSIS